MLGTAVQRKTVFVPSSVKNERPHSEDHVLEEVLSCLESAKAESIISIDIRGKSTLADYIIIASGRSQRHVVAVANHLLCTFKNAGYGHAKVEGLAQGDWVLIDAGDILIHLFRPEVRAFYNLEKIWLSPTQGE